MNKDLISVVVTTYKRNEFYLARALNSVFNQTYKNFEVIVIDDNDEGSIFSKNIETIVNEKYNKEKIQLIKHKKNKGAQVARNTGIRHARGEYVAFLDDDDEWMSKKLDLQMKMFVKSKVCNLALVYCGRYKITSTSNGDIKKEEEQLISPYKDLLEKLYKKNFIGSTSFPLIKSEVFDQVGLFDESLEAKQDYDMWLRIAQKYGVDYVPIPLCNYFAHKEERITTNIHKKLKAEIYFLNKYSNGIKSDRKTLSFKYKIIGRYYFILGNYNDSKKFYLKSLKNNPFTLKTYFWLLLAIIKHEPN